MNNLKRQFLNAQGDIYSKLKKKKNQLLKKVNNF